MKLTYTRTATAVTKEISWLHRDHLGSVRAITRLNPVTLAVELVERATYKPFGEQSEWLSPTQTAPETKGWIGERYDADAGLQYLNARYYDPILGMFLQPDWFEVTKAGVGTNRFSYSFNDPVNNLDPGGNLCIPCGIVIGAAIGYFSSADPANAPRPTDATLPSNGEIGLLAAAAPGAASMLVNGSRTAITSLAARNPSAFLVASEVGVAEATGMTVSATAVVTAGSELVASLDDIARAGVTIRGTPQVTPGGDGMNHAMASIKEAIDGVNRAGVTRVVSVDFNRPLSAILGIASQSRPDVTIVLKSGAVAVIEVVSRSQRASSQLEKIQRMIRDIAKGGRSASGEAKTLRESLEKKKDK